VFAGGEQPQAGLDRVARPDEVVAAGIVAGVPPGRTERLATIAPG
jgi:hypothetical protein